ncbi:MAG: hypothetical protein KTR31_21055, partial [Myxococcales bacterium]|nr:hypothetical protein [Myxococcales bacterium]
MGRVMGWAAWAPGGLEGLADDLAAGRSRLVAEGGAAEAPTRPAWFAGGLWRKASPLAQAAAVTVG